MSTRTYLQSVVSLLSFGIVLLIVGGFLSANGALPLALGCLLLGFFFCVAGFGVQRAERGR